MGYTIFAKETKTPPTIDIDVCSSYGIRNIEREVTGLNLNLEWSPARGYKMCYRVAFGETLCNNLWRFKKIKYRRID